jgi:hypothetical protein
MVRAIGAAVLACGVALALAACGDDSSGGGSGYTSYSDGCNQYTTCGSYTLVNGCGWCFNANGGLCAATPDECTDVNEFTWTWDSTGCPDLDASVTPVGAGGG